MFHAWSTSNLRFRRLAGHGRRSQALLLKLSAWFSWWSLCPSCWPPCGPQVLCWRCQDSPSGPPLSTATAQPAQALTASHFEEYRAHCSQKTDLDSQRRCILTLPSSPDQLEGGGQLVCHACWAWTAQAESAVSLLAEKLGMPQYET